MLESNSKSNVVKFAKIFGITWNTIQSSRVPHPDVRALKFGWSQQIFDLLNVKVSMIGRPVEGSEPMIYVGNHISYLDIAMLMHTVPSCCFVSKNEIRYWPIIGQGAVKADTIFVRRESLKSRLSVRSQILQALLEDKKKLVIFPSGTTTIGASASWKKGAFDIAHRGQIKIQPFRLNYTPARAAAYIDQDFFPTHVMALMKNPEIQAQIEFGEAFLVQDVLQDLARTKTWCEALLPARTQ